MLYRLPSLLMLLFGLILSGTDARAGAWPREQGSGFVSITSQLAWPRDMLLNGTAGSPEEYQTVYLEYGLTPRLTLGLDLGRSVSGHGKAIAFLQFPLRNTDSGPKISAQIGVGRISGETSLRPGLSIGWGRENGWLSIDSVAEIRLDSGQTDLKMDLTWGRNLPRDRKLLIQIQTGLQENDPAFARLAPSLVIPLRKRLKAEIGATYGLTGDTSMGLKLGLWSNF